MRTLRLLFGVLIAGLIGAAVPARADNEDVPYWASLRADEAYMRVGPSDSYKIDWVYRRKMLPMKVLRREGPWRFVVDPDGTKGWMRDLLLSRERSAMVVGEGPAEMHARAGVGSPLLWRLEAGVVGKLGDCVDGWCEFDVDGHKGFAPQDRLWGPGEP